MMYQHIHYEPEEYKKIIEGFNNKYPNIFKDARRYVNDALVNKNNDSLSDLESLILVSEEKLEEIYMNVLRNMYLCAIDIINKGDVFDRRNN